MNLTEKAKRLPDSPTTDLWMLILEMCEAIDKLNPVEQPKIEPEK